MTRDETIALWEKCEGARTTARASGRSELEAHDAAKLVWNSWASQLISSRSELEKNDRWASTREPQNSYMKVEIGDNRPSRDWIAEAFVNFTKLNFVSAQDTIGEIALEYPKNTITITQEEWFSGLDFENIEVSSRVLNFSGFKFPGSCDFFGTRFFKPVDFSSAVYGDSAGFRRSHFSDSVSFDHAEFRNDAWFSRTRFKEQASFSSAQFQGLARFAGATFEDIAIFLNSNFNKAWFLSVVFNGRAEFNGSRFVSDADFIGCQSDKAFLLSGVVFANEPPNFTQATFNQAPDLDNVEFPLPRLFTLGAPRLIPQYRAIRRMAMQGADYEREQMAYKGELRSRRWTTDKPWHVGLWLGIFYDGVADCGRSIVRPLSIWLVSVVAFAILYVRAAKQIEGWSCGVPFLKALFLSGRNALVLFNGGRDARITQAYQCLYGGNPEPNIPDSVSFLESFVQVPLSAVSTHETDLVD